ncbi:MAG: outer membrane lipoprotein carrier protein LolA [Bacteroidia bacterium]|nr:outer membrane lipoprotein carrier protein LolA [Bacteroidia bacterium]
MKKIIILFITFTLAFSVLAQDKAIDILAQFSKNIQQHETIVAEFVYSMENKNENLSDEFKGILYSKGDKFRVEIAGQIIMSDGVTLYTYIPEVDEVQINSMEESDDSFTPSKLFASYTHDYTPKFNKTFSIGPKKIHVIDLTPIDQSKPFTDAEIQIDAETLELIQFAINDANKNKFIYAVTKFFTEKKLEDSFFIFNANDYPDVEIIDMR